MKTAFIFPGQGAQYIGMAMDFVKANPAYEEILKDFDTKHNTNLYSIMQDGPVEALKETRFTQPAILFHSVVAMRAFKEKYNLEPIFVAGHSLGEITSLVANNVLSLEDAMHLVHKRGEFMIKANEGKPFAMAAIIGADAEVIKAKCAEASEIGLVKPANFNTPVQTVISGSEEGVAKACELIKEAGAKRVVPLVVGGPFHTPLIEKAGFWLAEEMNKIQFSSTNIPVVSNVDAKSATQPEVIRENLAKQVTSSVLWVDCVNHMIDEGVELFVEFGPKVLGGMIKKIDRKKKVLSVDKVEDIDKVISELESLC